MIRVPSSLVPLALAALFITPPASADTIRGAAGRVVEKSHRRDLVLSPHSLEVVDTHVFAADSGQKRPVTATYEFTLPADAVITSMSAGPKGKPTKAIAINAKAAHTSIPNPTGAGADTALLFEMAGDGAHTRYHLVLHPVTAAAPMTVEIRWTVPTTIAASLVTARVPMREATPILKGTALYAKAKNAGGLRLSDLRVDGVPAKRAELKVDAEKKQVTVQARVAASGRGTKLGYHANSLGGNLWALTVTGFEPQSSGGRDNFANVVVAIDSSKSMTDAGTVAAHKIADKILGGAKSAHVEVIAFSRKPTALFGGLRKSNEKTRKAATKALSKIAATNGSDLRAALHAATKALATTDAKERAKAGSASGRPNAIVVIGDGQTPLATDAKDLREALGDAAMKDTMLFSVDVASAQNPLPSPAGGVLSSLILETGGRTFGVRETQASRSGSAIAAALGPAAQLGKLEIRAGNDKLPFELPKHLAPGAGFTSTILFVGEKAPRNVELTAIRSGKSVTARASNTRGAAAAAAQLLRASSPETLTETAGTAGLALVDDAGQPTNGNRAMSAAGTRIGIVNEHLSMVVPDQSSKFARERLAFARKWGTELYRRAPTPDEVSGYYDLGQFSGNVVFSNKPKRLRRLVRGGGLDQSTIGRTIRTQLFRPVRHCYELALRRDSLLSGTARVRFEIARAEVIEASIPSPGGLPAKLRRCIIDAAYELNVPGASGDADTTYVVNYPFRLRPSKKGGRVERGEDAPDTSDPLDGL